MTVNITGFQRARRLASEKAARAAKEATAKAEQAAKDQAAQDAEKTAQDEAQFVAKIHEAGEPPEQQVEENRPPHQTVDPVDADEMAEDLNADAVDALSIEEVKNHLDRLNVPFAHNTGEAKLREKLTDAIG